jgi:hypothetical protein
MVVLALVLAGVLEATVEIFCVLAAEGGGVTVTVTGILGVGVLGTLFALGVVTVKVTLLLFDMPVDVP